MTKGSRTKEAILQAGLDLASRTGLSAISIGALADEVRMSKSGLFAHFRSKEKLQVAILNHAGELFVRTVIRPALEKQRGLARLTAMLNGWDNWAETSASGGCIFYAATVEYDDKPGVVRNRLKALQEEWLGTLEKAVEMAVETGEFKKGLDARQAAFELYSMVLGYYFLQRLLGDKSARRRRQAGFEKVVEWYRKGRAHG
jgi:AcrR family transcriptional regulator